MTRDLARDLIRDALAVAGLTMVGVGLWWLHPSAALIVLGTMLFGLAVAPLVIGAATRFASDTRPDKERRAE